MSSHQEQPLLLPRAPLQPLQKYINRLDPTEAQGLRDHATTLQVLIEQGRVASSRPLVYQERPDRLPPIHPQNEYSTHAAGYTRLLLVSSAVPLADMLLDACTDETAVVMFEHGSWTPEQLFQVASETLNGERVASIGILTDGLPGSIGLTEPGSRIDRASVAVTSAVQRFLLDLATLVRTKGRFDILSPSVAGSEEGQRLLGDLQRLTGRPFYASGGNTFASGFSLEYPRPSSGQPYLDPVHVARWRDEIPPRFREDMPEGQGGGQRVVTATGAGRVHVDKVLPAKTVVSAVLAGGATCLSLCGWAEHVKTDAEEKFNYCADSRDQETTDAAVYAWAAAAVATASVLLGNGAAGCCVCSRFRGAAKIEAGAVICVILSWAAMAGSLVLIAASTVVELDEINRGGVDCADLNLVRDGVLVGGGCLGFAAAVFSAVFYALVVRRRNRMFAAAAAVWSVGSRIDDLATTTAAGAVPVSKTASTAASPAVHLLTWMAVIFALVPAVVQIVFGAVKWDVSCEEDLQLFDVVHGSCVVVFVPMFVATVRMRAAKAARRVGGLEARERWYHAAATALTSAAAMVLVGALMVGAIWSYSVDVGKTCNEVLTYATRALVLCWFFMLLACGVWGACVVGLLSRRRHGLLSQHEQEQAVPGGGAQQGWEARPGDTGGGVQEDR